MKILRYIIVLTAFLSALCINAQLSTLKPVKMAHLSTPNNGSKNAAHIEIVFSEPIEGAKVVRDSENSTPDSSYPSTPGTVHAKGLAIEAAGAFAKKVTVVHPDFTPCVIDFESLGFTEKVQPGEHYRIDVEVPGLPLIEANRAFSDLNFTLAKIKYMAYLEGDDTPEAALARQRMAVMDELKTPMQFLAANGSSQDKATKFKCMKAAEMIYDKTHSKKAYEQYHAYRKSLYNNNSGSNALDEGVTELVIDTVYLKAGDNRPMSDDKLPHVDGAPFYSWINVKVDLNGVVFTGGNQYTDAELIDGAYRLYVPKGEEAAGEIVLHQADCVPLSFSLKDYGYDVVKPASVYVVEVKTPAAAIIEADRAFGNLDFPTAQLLYAEILNSADAYDDHTLSVASNRLASVTPLVENDVKTRWDNLRKDVSLKGGPIEREALSKKCMELASLADDLAALRVPGMVRKGNIYRNLAKEYKTAVFLTINAKEINKHKEVLLDKDGKPKVFPGNNIVLVFDKIGYTKDYEVVMDATSPGTFKKYLPAKVSEWLISNPGKSLKVTPKQYVWKGNELKLESIGDEFEISLPNGDRSLTMTQFYQYKK